MPVKLSPARYAGRLATDFAVILSTTGIWTSLTSDALALTGTFQTVQRGGADMEVEMRPGGVAHVLISYDPESTPGEFLEWHILTSPDGTNWDTVPWDAGTLGNTPDPGNISSYVYGPRFFKVEAALIDTDGTPGGDDVGSTLTVYIAYETE